MNKNNRSHTVTSQRDTAVVVIPADRPAPLAVARRLGRRGIPVYGVDVSPDAICMASRYLIPHPLPYADRCAANRLETLLKLGKELGEAVLYPVSDDEVLLVSEHRKELGEYFRFVMPDHEIVTSLVTKDGLHRVSEQHHIPAPRSYPAGSLDAVEAVADRLPYPVILKPAFSPSWLRDEIAILVKQNMLSGMSKVVYCQDAKRLVEMYRKIAVFDPRMIIEEVIPGSDDQLVYFCFYLDRNSVPLATFAGIKVRVLPVGFGSATYVRSFYDEKLEQASLRLLEAVRYQGLGGVEFKRDSRDGQYKLIEFNARLGMWDSYGVKCGVDIPYLSYCDALQRPVEPQRKYRSGVLWIDMQRDTRAFIILHRNKQLGLWRWLRSLLGEKEWAFFSWDDWKPAWVSLKQVINRQGKRKKPNPVHPSGKTGSAETPH